MAGLGKKLRLTLAGPPWGDAKMPPKQFQLEPIAREGHVRHPIQSQAFHGRPLPNPGIFPEYAQGAPELDAGEEEVNFLERPDRISPRILQKNRTGARRQHRADSAVEQKRRGASQGGKMELGLGPRTAGNPAHEQNIGVVRAPRPPLVAVEQRQQLHRLP